MKLNSEGLNDILKIKIQVIYQNTVDKIKDTDKEIKSQLINTKYRY